MDTVQNIFAEISQKNNDWFDENCSQARHDFKTARNAFSRSKDEESRLEFIRKRTRYNRVRWKAKYKFKQREGQRINKLAKSDPKHFWKNIKSMYKKKHESTDSLSVDDLFNHFSAMFGETDAENTQNQNSENDFPPNIVDEFNADFTESEISTHSIQPVVKYRRVPSCLG